MALSSMTGFARASGSTHDVAWRWEIRSVNGRGLDLRLRLPSGFEAIEQDARRLCQGNVARGSCTVTLELQGAAGESAIRLNELALRQAAAAAETARAMLNAEPVRLEALLGLRGVLDFGERDKDDGQTAAIAKDAVAGLQTALDQLRVSRRAEGERLGRALARLLDEIASLTETAARSAARMPAAIRARLKEQLDRLLDAGAGLSDDRLHQEAALLATRADIEEELERLHSHLAAARELLGKSEPVGRQLEFLAQEFNREANTICSKAGDIEITRIGLALKTAIDQLREQVQNIE